MTAAIASLFVTLVSWYGFATSTDILPNLSATRPEYCVPGTNLSLVLLIVSLALTLATILAFDTARVGRGQYVQVRRIK